MTLSTSSLLRRAVDGGVGVDDLSRPRRRRFTAEYKLAILGEYDRLTDPGTKGALLRREGLYSSHLVEWRRARDAGALSGLAGRPRPAGRGPESIELVRLRRRAERAEAELVKHKLALEIQGKHRSSWSGCWPRAPRTRGGSCDRRDVRRAGTAAGDPSRLSRGGPVPATHYRRRLPANTGPVRPRPVPPNALTAAEQERVFEVLRSERFVDLSPTQVWAILLDEGRYLASVSTMYRLLRAHAEVRERRRQATHPATVKPELVATAPNAVWSWDFERHEALSNRVGVGDLHRRAVAAAW